MSRDDVIVTDGGNVKSTETLGDDGRESDLSTNSLGVVILVVGANQELLRQAATAGSNNTKRLLKVSPDTPIGRKKKIFVGEASPKLREITLEPYSV